MATNQRVNVTLGFTADTSQAKQSILDLQSALSKIASTNIMGNDTQSLQSASEAAKELSLHLTNAYNANTGKLDLSKFNKSLESSKTNLTDLSMRLTSIGPEGQKAFVQLAQSIAAAERPVISLNSKISSMVQTLNNTIRWQVASSMIHQVQGAVQTAVGYAEDLNKSLNNIRIVSGQSVDQMTKFAEQANKAAKALSSTTLDYTDAALIYYQQGLSDEEVLARTDVTIKMANAAGESAQTVSDQLTAVWNNFYDGSKSLEYYADVMTKLGAVTASSTDEIAEGLEKFAAIADTVGLSYEYATAALATVTSNTRQSADVVGTAFKTIFARMQDLELGNTLDDGTTLGTYSQAMEKVGISVLDTNGNLIAMDDILDSMAAKWETLSNAQQVSLAQSVAGVRQYNQLISLMDNWNKTDADSMISNLGYVENAEGTLQEQADIFEESWEAAVNRVQASMEALYSDIIDDKFFIKLLDFLSEGIDSVDALIDGMGGIKPILVGLVGYFISAMSTKIEPAIRSIRENLEIIFTGKSSSAQNAAQKANKAFDKILSTNDLSEKNRYELEAAKELNEVKAKYNSIAHELTDEEKSHYELEIAILSIHQQEVRDLQKEQDTLAETIKKREKAVEIANNKFDAEKKAHQLATQNLKTAKETLKNDKEAVKAANAKVQALKQSSVRNNFDEAKKHTNIGNRIESLQDKVRNSSSGSKKRQNLSEYKNYQNQAAELEVQFKNFYDKLILEYEAAMEKTSGDLSKLGVNDLTSVSLSNDKLNEYVEELTKISQISGTGSFQKISEGVNGLRTQIEEATYGLINFDEEFDAIEMAAAGSNRQNLDKAISALIEKIKNAEIGTEEFEAILKKLGQKDYISSLRKHYEEITLAEKEAALAAEEVAKAQEKVKKAQEALNKQGATTGDARKALEEAEKERDEAEKKLKEAKKKEQELRKGNKEKTESFSPNHATTSGVEVLAKFAAGASQATMAVSSLKSAFSALGNEDLSPLEKTLTFISGIAIATTSGISALNSLKGAITGINAQLTGYIVTQTLANQQNVIATATTELYASEEADLTNSKAMQALVDQGLITEEQKLGLAKEIATIRAKGLSKEEAEESISKTINAKATENLEKQTKKNIASNILDALYTKLCTTATNADTVATELNTAAKLKAVAVALLANPITWLAVAATAALTFAIWKGVEAYNADAKAAERAREASEHFSEALETSKQELNDITSAFEEYQSLIDTLNECTKRTEEWDEALEDVKDSIWDILEAYPELAQQKDIFNDDGTLNQDTVNSYIADKKQTVNRQRAISLSASAKESQAQVASDITNTAGAIISKFYNHAITTADYQEADEFPIEDFLSQAIKKLNSEDLEGQNYNQFVQDYIDSLELSDENADLFAEDLKNCSGMVKDLADASNAAANQMQNVGKLLAGEILGNDATSEQVDDFEKEYNTEYETAYEAALEQVTPENAQKNINEYNEIMGTHYTLDTSVGLGDGSTLQLVDENGQSFKLTGEMFAGAKASSYAEQAASDAARKDLTDQLNFGEDLDLSSVISDEVDLSLVNSLVQSLNLTDETTQQALNKLLDSDQSALEQTKIIQELLDSIPSEEKEQAEIASLRSEAVNKYELDSEEIELQAKALQELYGAENLTEKQATKLAIANQRMNKGVEELVDNWEDWNAELRAGQLDKAEKGTIAYTRTVQDLTTTIANLVGASSDLKLSNEFFDNAENLDLISKAAQGSTDAINQLGVSVASDQLNNLEFDKSVLQFDEDGNHFNTTEQQFNSYKETVLNGMSELQAKLAEGNDLIGQSLGEILGTGEAGAAEWVNALNQMALATNMSVDEMNSMLGSMGLNADLDVTYKTVWSKKPKTKTVISYDEDSRDKDGNQVGYTATQETVGYTWVKETLAIPQIKTNDASGASVDVTYQSAGSVTPPSGGGSGGGSSSKSSKKDYTKKSEVVERYKEQNDILDGIENSLNRISKAADRAFGAEKIKQLKEEQKLYLQQKDALQAKLDLAEEYYNSDKQALVDEAAKYGITFDFDDGTGNITNYTAVMTQLYNELHEAETKYNSLESEDGKESYEESTLEPIQDKIDTLEDFISQYEETKELKQELKDSIQEAIYSWQDANYEELELKLELKLDIDDSKIQELEFLLTQYGDNFYKRAETAVAMIDKVPVYEDLLKVYESHQEELNQKYKDGKISQVNYIEGLKGVRDGYYEQLEALIALDEEMMTYYKDTLSAATAELEDYTDHMEHLTSVFEHYTNLMEILGKQKDYDTMGDFLSGNAETLRDRLDVAKQYYQILQDQRIEAEKALALADDEEEREQLKKSLDAIIDEVDAAEDEVLTLTEEWAEAMKAVIENEMASIADILEKALTNGLGFDSLMDSFDKLNTRQEEYLTKTNQIYETNKLMRTASKALDETDNKVSKQKLQNFIDETESLQEQTQLSEYELEIQQAKYDLLLAEIALEEAQNAKSTVRLSRDSEGNFGYVYTADQDAIDDAQQELDDAKNSLYNLSLEGQQDYTDKYLQAQQAIYEELTELQQQYLDGEITSEEEYERLKEEILFHYYDPDGGILTTYSKLYNVAVRTDADATADYWAKDYGAMTQNTAEWKDAVYDYLEEIKAQTDSWKQVSVDANEDVENALENSRKKTEELTTESEELKEMLENEVLGAIEDEIDAVRIQTEAYAKQREELKGLIGDYKEYIKLLNSQIVELSNEDEVVTDYSAKMAKAFLEGDMGAVNSWAIERARKEALGNYTSVSTDRLLELFEAAEDKNNQDALQLIKDVVAGKKSFTDSTVNAALGYDTGGYTGAWGPEGRLAFLHEKELVLNQDDTNNLLKTVSFIRELVSTIDSQASLAGLFNLTSTGIDSSSQTLEQNVHIEASFPNATNHNEIEEAFTNLVNRASQYANRK